MGCEVKICTSPLSSYDHCVLEKYQWVEEHLGRGFTKRIIFSKDKTLIHGDFLIDDNPEPEKDKALTPVWKHIIFDYPYNQSIKDKKRLETWDNWEELFGPP